MLVNYRAQRQMERDTTARVCPHSSGCARRSPQLHQQTQALPCNLLVREGAIQRHGHGRQGVEQTVTRVRQRQQRRPEPDTHLRAFRKTTGRPSTRYMTRKACIAKDTRCCQDRCRDRHVLSGGHQKMDASPQAATYARLNEAWATVSCRPIEAWAPVSCLSNGSWAAASCRSK